jgi:hypothetical protein
MAAEETANNLSTAIEKFILAHVQKLPIDAQRLARAGQQDLDAAANPAGPAVAALVRAERIATASSPEEAVVEASSQLFGRSSASDLLSLDRELSTLLERISHVLGPWPSGAGLAIGFFHEAVADTGDESRYWSVASRTYELVAGSGASVQVLTSSAYWVDDLGHLLLRANDAAVGVHGMLASARHLRQEVDALLTAVHALIEGVAKHLLALVLVSSGQGAYPNLRKLDASELIRRARSAGLGALLDGIDHTLRVAEAHDEFRVIGNRVRFTGRSAQYPELTTDELVDKALAAQESTIAILSGIYVASITAQAPPPNLMFEDFGLYTVTMVRSFMELGGYPVTDATVENECLRLSTTTRVSPNTIVQIAALVPLLPDDWDCLSIRDDEGRELVGPLSPIRATAQATDEFNKTVLGWETYLAWTLDGSRLISQDHLQKLVAVSTLDVLVTEAHRREKVRRLRILRAAAQSDELLADAVSAGIAYVREQAVGTASADTVGRLDFIFEAARKRLDSPFEQ